MKTKSLLKIVMCSGVLAFASATWAQTDNGFSDGGSRDGVGAGRDGGGSRGPAMFSDIRSREAVNYLESRYGPMKNWVCDKSRRGSGYALTEIGTGRPTNPDHGINRIPDRK